ncbi:MAG TPA: cytochrome c-type biogenesis protein CcmH [Candidatus Acidoferrales bacterium]
MSEFLHFGKGISKTAASASARLYAVPHGTERMLQRRRRGTGIAPPGRVGKGIVDNLSPVGAAQGSRRHFRFFSAARRCAADGLAWPLRSQAIRIAAPLLFILVLCASARAQQGAITAPTAAGLTPAQTARAEDVGKRVKCMCGGCDDAAGMCTHSGGNFAGPCDTAKAELKEVSDDVAKGQSDDQIQQAFVQEYGPTVLIEPPKKGFDLLAWAMPVALPIFAVLLVWGLVTRWRERSSLAPADGLPVDPNLLARAHRESADPHE